MTQPVATDHDPVAAAWTESVLEFVCGADPLLGVLAEPDHPANTAVIVIVGGPQYRVGSHRQFVLLTRHLAAAGYAALRFDVRGMGDSAGDARSFESISADISAAIDAVQQRLPGVVRFILWGLCDGASAALLYCYERTDVRISGLCLVNPWVRSTATLASTHLRHYYAARLRERSFWSKLLRGGVAMKAASGLLHNLRTVVGARIAGHGGGRPAPARTFQQGMAAAWRGFDGELLVLLSGRDYTAKEFTESIAKDAAWAGALQHPRLRLHTLANADHTFSQHTERLRAQTLTSEWLAEFWAPAVASGALRPQHQRTRGAFE